MSGYREAFHFAVRRPNGRYRRACDGRVRFRLPNEDTDTNSPAEVSCIRCRGTRAFRDATKGEPNGSESN